VKGSEGKFTGFKEAPIPEEWLPAIADPLQ